MLNLGELIIYITVHTTITICISYFIIINLGLFFFSWFFLVINHESNQLIIIYNKVKLTFYFGDDFLKSFPNLILKLLINRFKPFKIFKQAHFSLTHYLFSLDIEMLKTQRSSVHYYEDGDILVTVQHIVFRLHRNFL